MKRLALVALFALGLLASAHAQTAVDSHSFSNISATTSAFTLKGGNYLFCAVATFNSGTVKLETLGPDNSTYLLPASGLSLSANGCAQAYLPPGQYEVVIASATAVYASVAGVP